MAQQMTRVMPKGNPLAHPTQTVPEFSFLTWLSWHQKKANYTDVAESTQYRPMALFQLVKRLI